MNTVTAQQNDTIADICYRNFGYTKDVVEQVYDLNQGLAAQGPILAMGTKIQLPLPAEINQQQQKTIPIWD